MMQLARIEIDLAGAERRKSPRFPCHIECIASSIAGEFPITIRDVSEAGYGFTSNTVLPRSIQIAVKVETGPLEGAVGVVRWMKGDQFGVEFFEEHKGKHRVGDLVAQFLLLPDKRPA